MRIYRLKYSKWALHFSLNYFDILHNVNTTLLSELFWYSPLWTIHFSNLDNLQMNTLLNYFHIWRRNNNFQYANTAVWIIFKATVKNVGNNVFCIIANFRPQSRKCMQIYSAFMSLKIIIVWDVHILYIAYVTHMHSMQYILYIIHLIIYLRTV